MFLAGRDFRTRKLKNGYFNYYVMPESQFGVRSLQSAGGVGLDRKKERGTRKKEWFSPQSPADRRIRNSQLKGMQLALQGGHQIKNAALALTVVDLLQEKYPATERKIREGLSKVKWPGRMEVLSEMPWIVLDGAHNPGAMRTLAENLPKAFSYKKMWLVFGMMKDKNIQKTLDHITPLAKRIFLTRAEYDRSADPEDLLRFIKRQSHYHPRAFPTIPQAIIQAMKEAGPEDLILISGSLFVVGEARAWWERRKRSHKLIRSKNI